MRAEQTFEIIDPDGAASWQRGGVQHAVHEVVGEADVPCDVPVGRVGLLELFPALSHHASLHIIASASRHIVGGEWRLQKSGA